MKRIFSFVLAMIMTLLFAACGGQGAAATMHLRRTEGTVSVSDDGGKDVPLLDNLGLYSGYGVGTRSASYAWIDLDDVKLTKLDQNSEIAIRKEGKKLDIEVKSGSLFFNITEPLADDETLNIRTSTMLLGIRGTCGWVEDNGGLSRVYLLEGKVECSAGGQTVQVSAGEMALLSADGELTVKKLTEQDLPAFVRDEVDKTPGPDVSETLEPPPAPTPEATEAPIGEVTYSYSDGVLTISGKGRMDDYHEGHTLLPQPWFNYITEIHTVTIGNGVTSIGDAAFWNCTSLTGVTIPDSVTSIGDSAFVLCRSLISVTIPDSVTSLGEGAFSGCESLTSVTIGSGVTSIGQATFANCTSLTSVTIGSGVISIGEMAFNECTSLTSVTIPDGVTSIGDSAFRACRSLTSVTIGSGVTSIGNRAFSSCLSLTDVYYGGSESQWNQITGIGNAAFPAGATIHYNS